MTVGGTRIGPAEAVLAQVLEGEMVLLNLRTETYHALDDVGTRMWQLLVEHGAVEPAVRVLLSEYDVDEVTLRKHVNDFITELMKAQLLTDSIAACPDEK